MAAPPPQSQVWKIQLTPGLPSITIATMNGRIFVTSSRELEFTSAAEALKLVHELDQESLGEQCPILVSLEIEDKVMVVGLGVPDKFALLFTDVNEESFRSSGSEDPFAIIEFFYDDESTEFSRDLLIDKAQALTAIEEFARTGSRPSVINWVGESAGDLELS